MVYLCKNNVGGCQSMDSNLDLDDLNFNLLDLVACFTGNNATNKSMEAIKRYKILHGLFQLEENMHKILKQLNAYDASSILIAESNWMKRNHFSKYMPSRDANDKVAFGQVCAIDYGKTYKGEMGYIHPGLCVGIKEGKYLIIPITTGRNWRINCYHPIVNPEKTKEYRQALKSEGFEKDEVLLLNDAKFISGGRILELHEIISADPLKQIQEQLFQIMFPTLLKDVTRVKIENEKYVRIIENMERQIKNLKNKNNILSAKVQDLELKVKKS